jgi:prephenate dehydrogenase
VDVLTVVGVGLIGASAALAARAQGVARRIVGVDRSVGVLERAVRLGVIDEATGDLPAGVANAGLVLFCSPVDRIAEQVVTAAALCHPGTLLTDVGSTKAAIVRAVRGRLPDHLAFVPGHPLAGSEKNGPDFATAELFCNRLVVLTPDGQTADPAVDQIELFWQTLGARVCRMDAAEHDQALALTSHLPHLLASALAGILPPELASLTATGFRDTTRLAGGLPRLWQAILLDNREAILAAVEKLQRQIERYRQALDTADTDVLEALLTEAKKIRDRL